MLCVHLTSFPPDFSRTNNLLSVCFCTCSSHRSSRALGAPHPPHPPHPPSVAHRHWVLLFVEVQLVARGLSTGGKEDAKVYLLPCRPSAGFLPPEHVDCQNNMWDRERVPEFWEVLTYATPGAHTNTPHDGVIECGYIPTNYCLVMTGAAIVDPPFHNRQQAVTTSQAFPLRHLEQVQWFPWSV